MMSATQIALIIGKMLVTLLVVPDGPGLGKPLPARRPTPVYAMIPASRCAPSVSRVCYERKRAQGQATRPGRTRRRYPTVPFTPPTNTAHALPSLPLHRVRYPAARATG